mgnify:CR=1 FL=1
MKRLLLISIFILSCVTTFSQTGFRLHDKLGIRLGMGEDTVYFYAASREYGADAFEYSKGFSLESKRQLHKEFGTRWSMDFYFKDSKLESINLSKSYDASYLLLALNNIHKEFAKMGYFVTENLGDIYNRIRSSQGYIAYPKKSWEKETTYLSPGKDCMVVVKGDELSGLVFIRINIPPAYLNFEETVQIQRK